MEQSHQPGESEVERHVKSAGAVNRFEYLESIDSTNAELRRRLAEDVLDNSTPTDVARTESGPGPADSEPWPDFSALAAGSQTAGRGRLNRDWVSEPDSSVAVSLVLRPKQPETASWLSLAAGLAVADVVANLLPQLNVGVKWPNDVLVEGKKISGILAEALSPNLVILGIGLNLRPQLQFSEATSLSEHGQNLNYDDALELILAAFRSRYLLLQLGLTSQLRAELREQCLTLGQPVRAELPDGSELLGLAHDIDEQGRLQLLLAGGEGQRQEIATLGAADVWHLRN